MFKMYHGTTFKNAKNILENGFKSTDHNWIPSVDDMVYFMNPTSIENNEDCNSEYAESEAMRIANEEGQIANALIDNPIPITTVLEIQVPDDYMDCFENDNSCPNMSNADQVNLNDINMILKDTRTVIVPHYFEFYPKISLFYLVSLIDNKYMDLRSKLNEMDYQALVILAKNEVPYIEEIFEVEELSSTELCQYSYLFN